ncbi:integrin alpha-5-like isoform X2 [Pristis pectinata]|uniref:integrin alpha-5-like isoform X2 n=1 Tax=Pristis pectinata TaxID=685728 RepID=UPI00223E4DFF|nr:integrin alpha-5-like isoform X2 [Pristis pectinata]
MTSCCGNTSQLSVEGPGFRCLSLGSSINQELQSERRARIAAAAMRRTPAAAPGVGTVPLLCLLLPAALGFNLDSLSPAVFRGPRRSYFGFSVEFSSARPETPIVLIGAPKANTSQPNITESGAVYSCAWGLNDTACQQIPFDLTGNRMYNETEVLELKSNQWFGATIRSHNHTILACAPRYTWRENQQNNELVGTCYLSTGNFSHVVEYAPCRTNWHTHSGQGFCQGGFSADLTESGRVVLGGPGSFYWQGQLVSAYVKDIVQPSADFNFIQFTRGEVRTAVSPGSFDDSYLGYSLAVGEFNGDSIEDYVTGVPRGTQSVGYVTILNGTNMKALLNFSGDQMASYFGSAVAVTDINSDGLDDVLVGAPMFMERDSGGRLQEVGRVYVYLQTGLLEFNVTQNLTGRDTYGRYGTSVAVLGDLDQDGFNDVAVGAPYAGDQHQGLVYIYNGRPDGLNSTPSQILMGQWAATAKVPASFGFAVRGATDLDMNGYPDVIVGAFGVDRAVVYRARPIVRASAMLKVSPSVFNPEEKGCTVNNTDVTCINVSFCLSASGKHVPDSIGFKVELQLDKLKQQGAIKRVLFLHSQEPLYQDNVTIINGQGGICRDLKIYLLEEHKFRDKLSLIHIALNFSLDPRNPTDDHGLQPILSYSTSDYLVQKAQIQLDCGDDNICVPDLQLSVQGDRKTVYLGDENPLTLNFEARNLGEGGAYEAELYVFLPPEAHFSGIVRDEGLAMLSCTCDNQTVVCILGNPMKPGTNLSGGLRFTAHQLRDDKKFIEFELQIRSKNLNNSRSEVVPYRLDVEVSAHVSIRGVSIQDKILFPIPNWKPKRKPVNEEDVGPPVKHVFELSNNGPSSISYTLLHVSCPIKFQDDRLLYFIDYETTGALLNCTASSPFNPLKLKLQTPPVEPALALSVASEKVQHSIQRREAPWEQLKEPESLSLQYLMRRWKTPEQRAGATNCRMGDWELTASE